MEQQPSASPVIDSASRALLDRWVYVLVLTRGEFVAPYTAERQTALRASGEYEPDFFPFLERFLDAATDPACPMGNYFPGGWYRMLKGQGKSVQKVVIDARTLGPFFGEEVHVNPQGQWRVGPKPVTGKVLQFFMQHLRFDAELSRYFVRYTNVNYPETRYLRHESPPYRVRAVDFSTPVPGLVLNDGSMEPLRAASLRMNGSEALFCAVKDAELPAVFDDAPRFQVMDRLEDGSAGLSLKWQGKPVTVTLDAPWNGADGLPI